MAGSSAGAIAAMLLALNYSQAELEHELKTVDFNLFKDYPNTWWNNLTRGAFASIKNFFGYEHGLYEGDVLRSWLDSKVAAKLGKPNATFRDLANAKLLNPELKNLIVTGTNLQNKSVEFFSIEESPNVCLADAVRISSSIPAFFKEIYLNKSTGVVATTAQMAKDSHFKPYVDGGFLNNFPIEYFSQARFQNPNYPIINNINPTVLGLRVDSTEEQNSIFGINNKSNKTGFWNWVKSIFSTPLSDTNKLQHYGMQIISSNDFDVSATDFNLSLDMKETLIEEARKATTNYFELYVDDGGYLIQFDSLDHLNRQIDIYQVELTRLLADKSPIPQEHANRVAFLQETISKLQDARVNIPLESTLGKWRKKECSSYPVTNGLFQANLTGEQVEAPPSSAQLSL